MPSPWFEGRCYGQRLASDKLQENKIFATKFQFTVKSLTVHSQNDEDLKTWFRSL